MASSASTFVCVNPASANGRTGARWPSLAAALRAELGDFSVGLTSGPRQAGALVRRALEDGATRIVSVGGDGTHNEVLQGFFPPTGVEGTGLEPAAPLVPEATLHIIPTGTGGDLRRTLGLPPETHAAIGALGGEVRTVDVGHLRFTTSAGHEAAAYFLNVASLGLSGLVDKIVNESNKALGGRLTFLLGVARGGLTYRNQRVRLTLDQAPPLERTVNCVAVANARFYGGGMQIAPNADMADGALDVVVVGDMGALEVVRGLGRIYAGRHLDLPKIECLRGRRLFAEPTSPGQVVLLDMDGEQPGRLPATLTVVPGALRLGFGLEGRQP